jgi:hypothetical protein
MKKEGAILRTMAVGLAAGLLAVGARAQSYGSGDQLLVIGAAEFRPFMDGCTSSLPGDGYLISDCGLCAPMSLPNGAEITMMCLYAYDPDALSFASAGLQAVKMPAGGQTPGVVGLPGTDVQADFDIGYGAVCSGPLDFVVHDIGDVDGGGDRNLSYRVYAGTVLNGRLGGVRITWHRTVSPDPGTSSFNDVPAGSLYSRFIEAVKAAGITSGCEASPPLYCPDRPITRAEMAVFLSIALGLHWAN